MRGKHSALVHGKGKKGFQRILLSFCFLTFIVASASATTYTETGTVDGSTIPASGYDTLIVTGQIKLTINGTYTWNYTTVILQAPSGQINWVANTDLSLPNCTTFTIQSGAVGVQPASGGSASKLLEIGGVKIAVANTSSNNAAYSFTDFNAAGGLPTFNTSLSQSSICAGSSITCSVTPVDGNSNYDCYWTITSSTGGTFSPSTITNFNTAQTSTFTAASNASGSYTITCKITHTGDPDAITTKTFTVTINTLPTIYSVTGGGSYCSGGGGVTIGLSNSQTGVSYQLYNGATAVGSAVSGTNSAISFGTQTSAGTYTILATNGTTSCAQNMTGNATITINALPTTYNVTGGGSYCAGGSGVAIGLANSQSGVSYQLYNGVTAVGSAVSGTNSAISFGTQTSSGTYTVKATNNTTSCAQTMTGSTSISINARPTSLLTGTQVIGACSSSATLSVNLTGSSPWSITYNDGTTSTTVNNITTNPYNFSVSPIATKTYSVTALSDAQCVAIPASDIVGTATVTIPTGSSGVWTGANNTDWFDCRNWGNGTTPTSTTDVTISSNTNPPQIDATSSFALSYGGVALCRNLTIDGGTLSMKASASYLLASGNVTIKNNGTLDFSSGGTLELQGNWDDQVTTVGKGFTYGVGTIVFSGSNTQTLNATNATEIFYNLRMNKNASTQRLDLSKSITVSNNLILTKGIITTGNNLFTWNNSGTLTFPTTYSDSYIATVNSNGTQLSLTNPFDGSIGFRIKNVHGSTDQIFPVGESFSAPNRMAINMNNSTADDFTVVVTTGDVMNTPLPRINRIWYVKEATSGGSTATMKLYFTKRNWSTYSFGSANNDEVENGFLYDDVHLLQENYSNQFVNNSKSPSLDINTLYANNTSYPYGSEIYAQYTKGVSVDLFGGTSGITGFTRFTVANANGVILPVTLTNVKAYKISNAVQVEWSSLNESNIDHYEVEKSLNGVNFSSIQSIVALNNRASQNNYSITDDDLSGGNKFYRIKIIDKNGAISYSNIVSVSIANGKTSIMVMPNPVLNRTIPLQINNINPGKYNLVVYNTVGQQVMAITLDVSSGTFLENIPLSAKVAQGNYYLKLFNQNNTFTTKFVVAN